MGNWSNLTFKHLKLKNGGFNSTKIKNVQLSNTIPYDLPCMFFSQ